jgi:hypothetical protein
MVFTFSILKCNFLLDPENQQKEENSDSDAEWYKKQVGEDMPGKTIIKYSFLLLLKMI